MPTPLELLSPAKNLECGLAALHHGADAVYIGAPRFGAREAAGNSIEEIEKLATEARLFGAKTYVALNTILYDHELEEAGRMIHQVYEAGADALIIQDFGILEMDLPPIALHASTQSHNYTAEKLKFLATVGFERAVLARELSLGQIRKIANQTPIQLEAFVHGSLCVSLSGQCYMSHAQGGRSANRGACAQPCRKKYTLTDATGRVLEQDKHLLSLRDMNRSASLEEMADAGITSFKIEGRLKEVDYVKNITAHYRKLLDELLTNNPTYQPASRGTCSFSFVPDPARTFHRGATEYFLRGRKEPVARFESPKSTGEWLGIVTAVKREAFQLQGSATLVNNDGLTFLNKAGDSVGLKVNKCENGWIYPDRMNGIYTGASVSRNMDHAFQMILSKKTSERKLPLDLRLSRQEEGFRLETTIGEKTMAFDLPMPATAAREVEKSRSNILQQLSRSGDTPFKIGEIDTGANEAYFFTNGQLNELRRGLLQRVEAELRQRPSVEPAHFRHKAPLERVPFPMEATTYELNVSNRLAQSFYRKHGVENPQAAVEKRAPEGRLQVMVTKHCLRHELGMCHKFGGTDPDAGLLPFRLRDGETTYTLEFDCDHCLMKIFR
ncbi:MAG: U32 family peptidase [Marinilabiliales bacterium]|nr:U32 family peptidase [Marinilabiliales bacterium]